MASGEWAPCSRCRMNQRLLRRLEAGDRRRAGIHEAGHFVVASSLGLKGIEAWIAPTGSTPNMDEAVWIGQFGYFASRHLSALGQMKIAVAGHVAEQCWWLRNEADAFPIYWEDNLWDDLAMSPADWAMARHTPGQPSNKLVRACEAVEAILMPGGRLWPTLLDRSRQLLRERWISA